MKKLLQILLLFCAGSAFAQKEPEFKKVRYDDNFNYLANDTVNRSWYDQMKYIPLGGKNYMSTGGEVRYRYLYTKNDQWGDVPQDNDGYTLTRILLHADTHLGWFRFFVQLQASEANSLTDPSPVDENPLDLHQAFFDIDFINNERHKLVARLGRQEMTYGSQRLVGLRERPNNRMAFDGAKVIYATKGFSNDAFYTHPVQGREGIFDDYFFNENAKFWGDYAVFHNVPFFKNIDVYYLGLWKRNWEFNDATGRELRHSFGTRIWGSGGNWDYDFEGIYQLGDMAGKDISAWTLSSSVSYEFAATALKPKIGLKTEIISGDKKEGDNKLNTFNPLYPRGAYFGLIGLIGPANMYDFHPSLGLELSRTLYLNVDSDFFWRMDSADGIYAPNVTLIYPSGGISDTYIGTQLASDITYTPNNFLSFTLEGTWFSAGDFIKESGAGKDVLFAAITAQFRF